MKIQYQVRVVVEEVVEQENSDICFLDTLNEFCSPLFATEEEAIKVAYELKNQANLDY